MAASCLLVASPSTLSYSVLICFRSLSSKRPAGFPYWPVLKRVSWTMVLPLTKGMGCSLFRVQGRFWGAGFGAVYCRLPSLVPLYAAPCICSQCAERKYALFQGVIAIF